MLESLLSSKNSIQIGLCLSKHSKPISLRILARYANLPVSSTELVIKNFLTAKIIKVINDRNRKLILFDREQTLTKTFLSLLEIIAEYQKTNLLNKLSAQAKASIKFSDEVNAMMRIAKKSIPDAKSY